jgi:hypothetical protein
VELDDPDIAAGTQGALKHYVHTSTVTQGHSPATAVFSTYTFD